MNKEVYVVSPPYIVRADKMLYHLLHNDKLKKSGQPQISNCNLCRKTMEIYFINLSKGGPTQITKDDKKCKHCQFCMETHFNAFKRHQFKTSFGKTLVGVIQALIC